ncbi:DNA recombination protein RmuC [Lewinellaceae bacterium SD302]|nr:DNA recombination protein RmuC [Lewinellaceae bacterium SD302]
MPIEYSLIVAVLCLLVGGLITYLYLQLKLRDSFVARSQLQTTHVSKELYDNLQQQADLNFENLQEKIASEQNLSLQLTKLETEFDQLEKQLTGQREEMERLQAESHAHFERVAARLFEEKGQRFTRQNAEQLNHLLAPLQNRIKTFEEQIQKRFVEETRDRVSIKEEIIHLRNLNAQLSTDANNLADALRGDNKMQGDWGEWQLETLLKSSGLEAGVHYVAQNSFRDEEGRQKRPDFIINLPDDKHLVIDSKVSLAAYERFSSCSEDADQKIHLKSHCQSLRQHVKDLSSKKYEQLYQINSPDYLLLFVPIEPAYNLALREDRNIFMEALDRNIVIVTNATLLSTLRTVSYIWKQEKQQQHVQEIAYQSGLMYDKFVGFVNDLQDIGTQLDRTQKSYQAALNKLKDGGKKGDTLIGRAERLRELGARAKKRLPEV